MSEKSTFHEILTDLLLEETTEDLRPSHSIAEEPHPSYFSFAYNLKDTLNSRLGKFARYPQKPKSNRTQDDQPVLKKENPQKVVAEPEPHIDQTQLSAQAVLSLRLLGWVGETLTRSDIKRLYRTKVKSCHPDLGGNADLLPSIYSAYELLQKELGKKAPSLSPDQKSAA